MHRCSPARTGWSLALLGLGITLGCSGSDQVTSDGTVAALLGDGRIVFVPADTSLPIREFRPDSAIIAEAPGRLLEQSADGNFVIAALPRADFSATTLAIVDLKHGTLDSREIRDSGVVYWALALGPRTGLAYLVGSDAGNVTAATHEVPSLARRTRRVGQSPRGMSTYIRAEIDHQESRLYLTDGGRTDWFELEGDTLRRCFLSSNGDPCIQARGPVQLMADGLIVAARPWQFTLATLDGQQSDSTSVALHGNTSVAFVIDTTRRRIVAVGSCRGAGGLVTSRFNQRPNAGFSAFRDGRRTGPTPVCGERVAIDRSGRTAVVAQRAFPMRGGASPGKLVIVDVESGKTLRTISVPAAPIDVILLRR